MGAQPDEHSPPPPGFTFSQLPCSAQETSSTRLPPSSFTRETAMPVVFNGEGLVARILKGSRRGAPA